MWTCCLLFEVSVATWYSQSVMVAFKLSFIQSFKQLHCLLHVPSPQSFSQGRLYGVIENYTLWISMFWIQNIQTERHLCTHTRTHTHMHTHRKKYIKIQSANKFSFPTSVTMTAHLHKIFGRHAGRGSQKLQLCLQLLHIVLLLRNLPALAL